MGINDIELPAALIADLYQHALIGEAGKATGFVPAAPLKNAAQTPAESISALKWLGNNEKQVLIVVNHADAAYLPDKQLTFLTGILTACRLSIADVAILNTEQHTGVTYKEAIDALQSRSVILFGIEPADFGLPLSFPHYQLQPFSGVTYLAAPTLLALENDKVEKSKLWVCLKRLYNV